MTRNTRSRGRDLAFQTLFELEQRSDREPAEALRLRVDAIQEEENETVAPRVIEFASRLLLGVLQHRTTIDCRIAAAAPAFPIDQMAVTDRVALELASEEMFHEHRTPIGVVINEAVELAKTYGGENSGRFVNGVLGTIAGELQAATVVESGRESSE